MHNYFILHYLTMIIKFIFMMNMYLRLYSNPSRNETCAAKGHTFFDVLDEPAVVQLDLMVP